MLVKGIVHFEINLWYDLAYLKGIQIEHDLMTHECKYTLMA